RKTVRRSRARRARPSIFSRSCRMVISGPAHGAGPEMTPTRSVASIRARARKPAPHQACQSFAEHARVRRALAIENACLVKEHVRGVLLEAALLVPEGSERDDDVVTRIDLQDRLRGAFELARARKDFL